MGLRGSRLRLALRWVRVRRAAAAPIVSPPGGIVLCFALILWEIKGGVLCLAGLGTALLLRAAPAAMLEGLRGASSTPGPGGSTRWGNSPHEHGVRATPKEKPFSRRVPAPRTWQAGASSTGMGAAPCGAPLAFEPGAASPGLDTNACQDALLSPQRGLLVYSRQAIAAGKKTIAEVFLIRNEVGLAALNCLV